MRKQVFLSAEKISHRSHFLNKDVSQSWFFPDLKVGVTNKFLNLMFFKMKKFIMIIFGWYLKRYYSMIFIRCYYLSSKIYETANIFGIFNLTSSFQTYLLLLLGGQIAEQSKSSLRSWSGPGGLEFESRGRQKIN